jgi:LacI family transcriptional regulator
VGFDDNTHFSLFSPAISAIAQPVRAISETTIQKLVDGLSGEEKDLPKETTVLPVRLIVRESSVPVRLRQLRS